MNIVKHLIKCRRKKRIIPSTQKTQMIKKINVKKIILKTFKTIF